MKYMDMLHAISSQGIEVIIDQKAPLPLLFLPGEKILVVQNVSYLQKILERNHLR